MRRLLRGIGRNRVVWKQLPPDLGGGRVCCSPEATLSVLKPGWASTQAAGLFDWARRYTEPGARVWDLGANQGLFAFAAAARALKQGEVVAFEPDPYLVSLMELSVASDSHRGGRRLLGHHRPIVIVEVAEECADSVADTFSAADYLMYDIRAPEDGPIRWPAWNTLAVPMERSGG